MSNKFTGITSAGSAIPVYDKDAHEALSSKLDTSAFSSVSGEFATVDDVVAAVSGKADTSAIPSLDGYATQEWVGEQGYLTEVPAGYATTEDVISATSGLQPSGDYASATDLANYQPVSAMTAFQPVGDYYSASNPSGFLIADDITGKMDVTGMTAYQPAGDYQPSGDYLSASESANFYPMTGNPSGFLTEHQSLDGLMETSGLEYDGDKISGYMGSAFAGGGEVPEGVMVESAVGYNAVNEISGYNGSAIAQYGAEKQWLVHDDTLVHAANSAQYALGVNLSAVAQLLGEYPISITESGVYTLNSTYISGTSYLYWYYLSNGMCRIKGQLRPTTAMPATWHTVQIASNGASALMDNTYIPTLIDWEGWVDYLSWFSDGTLNFNSREVSPTAANRLIYVDYLGIPKR